ALAFAERAERIPHGIGRGRNAAIGRNGRNALAPCRVEQCAALLERQEEHRRGLRVAGRAVFPREGTLSSHRSVVTECLASDKKHEDRTQNDHTSRSSGMVTLSQLRKN